MRVRPAGRLISRRGRPEFSELPGDGEGAKIRHPVEEEGGLEMVDLVLEHPGKEILGLDRERLAASV